MRRWIWLALALLLLAVPARADVTVTKLSALATNTTSPLNSGDCLYVLQASVDTKLCSNWAATFGALLPSLSNLTATALPSGFTLPSPALTGTVTGANTIPYSILQQAAQRTILGNATTGTANITAGWAASGNASTVATTTGSLTNGHCVDIDVNGNFVDAGAACSSGGGGGSVTSVGLSVPAASIFGVTASPITTAGTVGLTTTGTSGGVPYFSSGTQLSSSAQMPANHAITGGGAGASPKDSKVTITIPATGATLTISDGKTLTATNSITLNGSDGKVLSVNNTLTFAGTDGTTQTFQASDTILGRATTDTLTNKTYDTAGTGNVFKIAGAQLTSISGTGGTVALTTSPTFVTPTLGAASGTSLNIASPDQSISLSPIGNAVTTLSSFAMQGTTQSATTREYLVALGLNNNKRSTLSGANADSSTLFLGASMAAGGGNTWSINGETLIAAGLTGMGLAAEWDVETNSPVVATLGPSGLVFPANPSGAGGLYAYGEVIAGATSNTVTAGFVLSGGAGGFLRGHGCTGTVAQACFFNYSNSAIGYDDWGTHTTAAIDLSNSAALGTVPLIKATSFTVTYAGIVTGTQLTVSTTSDSSLELKSSGTSTPDWFWQAITTSGTTGRARLYDNVNAREVFAAYQDGTAKFFGQLTVAGPVILQGYTVSTLPSGVVGMMAYVTDASVCTFLAAVVATGSTKCPVFYNGSAWVGG